MMPSAPNSVHSRTSHRFHKMARKGKGILMEYRTLGKSGLKVSEIGLGGNNFGGRADEKTSAEVLSCAFDLGVNFVDTSPAYGLGRSEEIIGKAVKGRRSDIIIATKFGSHSNFRPDRQRGARMYIMESIEGSLKRLGTDYVDVLYMHNPDPETPILETLRTLDNLIRMGKVRYIGCSSFAAWQLADALWTSRAHNLESFVVAGGRYNIFERYLEREFVPCCTAFGVSLVPTVPLAGGFLSGKYRRGEPTPKATRRLTHEERQGNLALTPSMRTRDMGDVLTDSNFDKLEKLEAFAMERDHSVGELAIAWLLAHPWLGTVIAGAMTPEQVTLNVAAHKWKLTPEEVTQLEKLV